MIRPLCAFGLLILGTALAAPIDAARAEAGGPALPVSVEQIEDEAAAVVKAAELGGPAGLRQALEDCWFASAGYGIEALTPCVTREASAQALVAALEAKIGPLEDPALSPTASRDRLETAYEARSATPPSVSAPARALIGYAVSRRVERGWAGAPALTDLADWAEDARRALKRDGAAAYRDQSAGCWMRLALARSQDPDERAAGAWACRVADFAVSREMSADYAKRTPYFESLTGAAPAAAEAVAAATRALVEAR